MLYLKEHFARLRAKNIVNEFSSQIAKKGVSLEEVDIEYDFDGKYLSLSAKIYFSNCPSYEYGEYFAHCSERTAEIVKENLRRYHLWIGTGEKIHFT